MIIPTILSNDYKVGSTIDDYGHTKVRHLSISSSDGNTDPTIADKIALEILGKGYILIGEMNIKGVYHYMKPIDK